MSLKTLNNTTFSILIALLFAACINSTGLAYGVSEQCIISESTVLDGTCQQVTVTNSDIQVDCDYNTIAQITVDSNWGVEFINCLGFASISLNDAEVSIRNSEVGSLVADFSQLTIRNSNVNSGAVFPYISDISLTDSVLFDTSFNSYYGGFYVHNNNLTNVSFSKYEGDFYFSNNEFVNCDRAIDFFSLVNGEITNNNFEECNYALNFEHGNDYAIGAEVTVINNTFNNSGIYENENVNFVFYENNYYSDFSSNPTYPYTYSIPGPGTGEDLNPVGSLPCPDNDGDGYGRPASNKCEFVQLDCRDDMGGVNPGMNEVCGNRIDDNCNGVAEEICRNGRRLYYQELDPESEGSTEYVR